MNRRWRCLRWDMSLKRDLNIRIQSGQATVKAVKSESRESPRGEIGNVRLGYTKQFRRLALFQTTFFEQKIDLARQLDFGETFFAIVQLFKRMQGFYDDFIVTAHSFCHGVLLPF